VRVTGKGQVIHNPNLESSEFYIYSGFFRGAWSSGQGWQVGVRRSWKKSGYPVPIQLCRALRSRYGRVVLKNKAFFIDKTGTRVTPEFDGAFDFREDLAAVEVGKNVGSFVGTAVSLYRLFIRVLVELISPKASPLSALTGKSDSWTEREAL